MNRNTNEIVAELVEIGIKKTSGLFHQTFLKATLAGIFIVLGGVGSIKAKAAFVDMPGDALIYSGLLFPLGFVLIILLGAELFTGNALMTIGYLRKKYTFTQLIRNWSIVWVGNLVGVLFMVALLYIGGTFNIEEQHLLIKLTEHKVSIEFISAITLGILCNIIVTLVVMVQMAAKEVPGTILASVFGIMVFVISGYEHVVANMFYMPLGYLFGADVTIIEILLNNWLPVTIGNIIGGGIIVPLLFHIIYKNK